jgi:hypothetical protein
MIFRILGVSAALLLAGCSSLPSLDSLLTFDHDPEVQASADPAVAPAATPPPAMGGDWCKTAATTARNRSAADGFDTATQETQAQQVYRQCVALNGLN